MTQSKNNNIEPDGKRRIRRAYGIFFPFWPIYFYGAARLIPTLAVTLLLDSAFLIAAVRNTKLDPRHVIAALSVVY